MPVAELWRGRHPQRRLVIAGDDDYELPLRTPPLPNVGREKATLAAHAANAALLLPNLGPGDEGLSDWNDVARRMGRDALANQVFEAVKAAPRGDWRAPSDSEATVWMADLEKIPDRAP